MQGVADDASYRAPVNVAPVQDGLDEKGEGTRDC